MPKRHDLEMYSGDTLQITVTVKNTSNVAIDLSGATLSWALAKNVGDTALVTKTTANSGVVTVTAASGICRVDIVPADTSGIFGRHWHELEVTDSSGNVSTVIVGQLNIVRDLVT
jgi:hypothetical protein